MVVNGFEFVGHNVGTSGCYYVAKRGNEVYTSKSMTYLRRKAESMPPVQADRTATLLGSLKITGKGNYTFG